MYSCVRVEYHKGLALWLVNINVHLMKGKLHVSFGGGWKCFAKCHDIIEGGHMSFTLIGQSELNVMH